ncbi:HD domain-containing protein [Salinibacillus xinjiangensis]|uniref:HD domain-containing protein n=1 Tax=Salinibacillus xinjiangensis TaxID=1229268 RepID=A0A6G1X9Y8_9BACI|nr:HD domain-containing protein [Salinibacillus xinjiangensis]MRG87831.1 HD domain-containing protein [Salinibacillus xinjiangensis]
MRKVTLKMIYEHPITQKYVRRSGMAHAISVAYHAFRLAKDYDVNPDWAVKAGFLHDIGHYEWYQDGEWDYSQYRNYDIHPIKGAERAHKLLVRLGEDKRAAKEISHAVLFHTDSALPEGNYELNSLQKVVHLADERDKQPGDFHHYRNINQEKEVRLIEELDQKIENYLAEKNRDVSKNG